MTNYIPNIHPFNHKPNRWLLTISCIKFLHSIFVITFISIILMGGQSKVIGQNIQNDTVAKFNKNYLVSYWHDTRDIAVSPFHWKAKEWSAFAGVAGVTAITFAFDQEIFDFVYPQRTTTTSQISQYLIEPWGSGVYSLPLLAGIYITGHKNNRHRNVALTGLKAFILAGGAVTVVKHLFHRHRPSDNDPPDPWIWDGPFPVTSQYTSFPSGHAATAFAVASVLACGYKDKPWIGISSYTVATLVGISRIHDQKHWASDVFIGAAIGTFIGTSLCKLNMKDVQISPMAIRGGGGVSFRYRL